MNPQFLRIHALLWILIFSLPSVYAQDNSTSSSRASSVIQSMDTLFQPAANSSGYFIIRNSDLERLKKDITTVISEKLSVQSPQAIERIDTVYIEKEGLQATSSELAGIATDYTWLWIITTIIFMLACVILAFLNSRNRKQTKDSIDRLANLQTDFDRHKMNSIERERKLMRELIDARSGQED